MRTLTKTVGLVLIVLILWNMSFFGYLSIPEGLPVMLTDAPRTPPVAQAQIIPPPPVKKPVTVVDPPKKSPEKPLSPEPEKLRSLWQYVNPWIGTGSRILGNKQDNSGNVWLGATAPNGMVKVSVDVHWVPSGYHPTKPITGISFLHVSGTGGGDSYHVITMHPTHKTIEDAFRWQPEHSDQSSFSLNSRRSSETWRPGYYGVHLEQVGCWVEFAATERASIHRYTLKKVPESKEISVIFDVARNPGLGNGFVDGEIHIEEDGALFKMRGQYQEYWATGFMMNGRANYNVFLCARLSQKPDAWGVWDRQSVKKQTTEANGVRGAYATFKVPSSISVGRNIEVRTGISYVSWDQACRNMEEELQTHSLEDIAEQTEAKWEDKLNLISIEDPTPTNNTIIFYTSLMRSFFMPVNQTGENPKWKSVGPYYNDWYCIWDTFRTLHPFLTLVAPDLQAEMLNSILNIFDNEGWLFDSRAGGYNGLIQGGSNADVLFADAYAKGLKGIDWKRAYAALKKNALEPSPEWTFQGRGGVEEWKTLGFLPANGQRAGSRTMEYSYNDYCIHSIAKGLGETSDAKSFLKTSRNWQNLWNPDTISLETKGFIIPKTYDGNFVTGTWGDPLMCSPNGYIHDNCHMSNNEFYEDSSWSYSLYVPHDIPKLIELCGGEKAFVKRLDKLFDGGHFYAGNEPSFLLPYLYNFVGRHDKTIIQVRKALTLFFNADDGIPGNDDSGAMATWFMFSSLGFFPVAGQDLYLLGYPSFEKVTIKLGPKNRLLIEAKNHGLPKVEKVTLNGQVLDAPMFRHNQIADGGHLVFYLTN